MDTGLDPDIDLDDLPAGQPAGRWRQINLTFTDREAAERYAAHLGPVLAAGQDSGVAALSWFIRKGRTWRLRLLPGEYLGAFYALLARVADHDLVRAVAEPVYAPETDAFGGAESMTIAHTLFAADTRHILAHVAAGGDQRRELGVRLATRLMQAAGLDFYEQGDVWARVAAHRQTEGQSPASAKLTAAVYRMIIAMGEAAGSPLERTPDWPEAHERAGRALGFLNEHGVLTRDLRAVLTHHVLFTFNRLGISAVDARLLAAAAATAVFHADPTDTPHNARPGTRQAGPAEPRMPVVNDSTDTITPDADQLRDKLADILQERGYLTDPRVEQVFRTVPREHFLPGVPLDNVYAPTHWVTKRDDTGAALSSASAPSLVADMLEQLDAQPGQKILEIGAATGVNAAYLAELTAPDGHVVTIEVDQDLTDGALANVARAGYTDRITVLCGDGALGHADAAPYDGIIVTAGAWDISAAWWAQLRVGGRLVVPLRLHECGLTRSFAFTKTSDNEMVADSALVCGFVPMRGSSEHADAHLTLAGDVVLKYDPADLPDVTGMTGVLDNPRHETWTTISVDDSSEIGHFDLYMMVHGRMPFGRLGVGSVARETGLVKPAYRWNGAVLFTADTIAYPAFRQTGETSYDLGVIAHGPNATTLAADLTDLVYRWQEAGQPNSPTATARRPDTGPVKPDEITRPDSIIAVDI
ncbi:methyltransferase, FxLD system [Longispora sp. NPDC051575]|uniref:methyltransferase, FxLD system n=1 Tax=Longispora sp. NPDC051575 TaxID=3154943 RepID=UPI003421F5B1